MSLPCQKACLGEIKAPSGEGRMTGWFYEGDEVTCPLCGAKYTAALTADDAPYLIAKEAT